MLPARSEASLARNSCYALGSGYLCGILKKQYSCWVVQYIPCASIFPCVFVVLLVELLHRAALELGHYRVDRMIVHRLDMATSGCVIMARTDAALKDLNRQVCLLGC